MIITINHDWRIRSDPRQWIVERRRRIGGDYRWDAIGYFHTLDNAVLQLAQRRVRLLVGEYPADALAPLCHSLDTLKSEILSALDRLRSNTGGEK